MKTGIITLNGDFNYGNRLQLYASCKIYQSLSLSPTVLVPKQRFDWQHALLLHLINMGKWCMGRPVATLKPEDSMSPERLKQFHKFNALMHFELIDRNEMDQLSAKFDYFSVGSDQVWNPQLIKGYEDWYFLSFARPEQRIALAPSVGLDVLDASQARRLAEGVRLFNHPSVRESCGAKLIKECAGIDAEVICDPTLVLSQDEWRAVASDSLTPQEPYVFTYLLGEAGNDVRNVLDEVTECGNVPIISLSDREKSGELPAGPAQFISLIDHASHVVTDSFHASVFSCLMETPLTIVRRRGNSGSMFSRIETLAEMLGIKEKVYGSSSFDLSYAGDYGNIAGRIENERKHFMDYLVSRLEEG